MGATNTETFENPRDSLPNVYTDIHARELDFVTRFGESWKALQEVLGIMRPIKKENGAVLRSYTASVDLEDGDVPAGAVIPYSKATVTEATFGEIKIKKYAKAVTIEDVNEYGEEVAIQKTDKAFLNELQGNLIEDFYGTILNDVHAMTGTQSTFQMAIAMAIGKVVDKFKKMRKDSSAVVVWVNTLDVYEYVGAAGITLQNAFGIQYVKDFLGADTMIVSSEIPRGKVIAIPVENLILYYIDPATQFARLGLTYTTDGETNLIGFKANPNYSTAVGESFALQGMKLWFEYADGVDIETINSGNLSSVTVAPVDGNTDFWGTLASTMQTSVSVAGKAITGTLHKLTSGSLVDVWGEGYFIGLGFSNFSSGLTYANCKVGLTPSVSSGLVALDSDCMGVFKVTDKGLQRLVVAQEKDGVGRLTEYYDLSGLTLD